MSSGAAGHLIRYDLSKGTIINLIAGDYIFDLAFIDPFFSEKLFLQKMGQFLRHSNQYLFYWTKNKLQLLLIKISIMEISRKIDDDC